MPEGLPERDLEAARDGVGVKPDHIVRQEQYVSRLRAIEWLNAIGFRAAQWVAGDAPGSTCRVLVVREHSTPDVIVVRTFEAWVEEPFPLDFPSETWKQRVMLLA